MIVDILIITFSAILSVVTGIAPTWQIWPDIVLHWIKIFTFSLMKLNIFIPVGGETLSLFSALTFFIDFQVLFFSFLLFWKLISWFRGTK